MRTSKWHADRKLPFATSGCEARPPNLTLQQAARADKFPGVRHSLGPPLLLRWAVRRIGGFLIHDALGFRTTPATDAH